MKPSESHYWKNFFSYKTAIENICSPLILVDGTASLSSLQGVVASTQALRSQGPSLTPSLANYFRADLIAHVTNWPADLLEKQVNIRSENRM